MTPEQKLKRFLQYGREISLYEPGDRSNKEFYQPRELESIEAFIESGKFTEPVAIIVKAFSDGYSSHPEMIVYALAICAKQKKNVQLTTAAYKAFKTVCATPENMFLFIKYAVKLAPNHSIWGSGFQKVVRDWYLSKDPKTLAEIVTKKKKCHGWRHKDIMKLIHLKSDNPVMAAIIKYVLYDIATAKKEYGDAPGASEILNYIQSIEDFRRMTDEQQAARTLESLHLTLDHVPVHFLRSSEIWSGLVGNIPLGQLIQKLEHIGYLGFLEPNSPVLPRVLDALRDERSIAESHLHPAQVFVALKKYEMSSKFAAAENAEKKRKTGNGDARNTVRVPPKPNPQVVTALNELFASTCKLFLAPTGLDYHVDIRIGKPDDRFVRMKDCTRCPHVTFLEATMVTCLCLLHADKGVSIVSCDRNSYVPVPLTSDMSIKAAMDMFKEKGLFYDDVPLYIFFWIVEIYLQKYDVFILIIKETIEETIKIIHNAFESYRTNMNMPNAKLVIIHLTASWKSTCRRTFNNPDILEIIGFDGNVPRIIEAFSRGAF